MKRGDIVVFAASGDYGKPRPALIIQTDLASGLDSVVVLPLTSDNGDSPLLRPVLPAGEKSGLRVTSFVMIDKITTVKRRKVGDRIGEASPEQITEITRLLALFLGIV